MSMQTASAKASLRRVMAERVARLSAEERTRHDARICAHLSLLPLYRAARQLLAYAPMRDEVSLTPLFEQAEQEGKVVFLPIADVTAGTLAFRRWSTNQPLERSNLGVSEPSGTVSPDAVPSVMLVPGRAFDRRGCRLGRGGGFYDRALAASSPLGPIVGVAYAVQLVESVPHGPLDRPVDAIVTEDGFSWADRG